MPRALRGRFEALDHFVLGHLSILGPLSTLGSPHAAKRFIGLAIVVRRKDRRLHASHIPRMSLALRTAMIRPITSLWPLFVFFALRQVLVLLVFLLEHRASDVIVGVYIIRRLALILF